MSKCIFISHREKLPDSVAEKLYEICQQLSPDNIIPPQPRISLNGNIAYGIVNPTSDLLINGNSFLLGKIFDNLEDWDKPDSDFPDGSYALFRSVGDFCEIVTDSVASRTIWYYMDEKQFIASTSQRAIIMSLGNFDFDERVIPWILSTGTLGPGFSWDSRIKRIPPDSSVRLDIKKWTVSVKSKPALFKPIKKSGKQHEKLLYESIKNTFTSLNLDYSKWFLLLSGGYDSRGILCLLLEADHSSQNIKTVTWGLKSSQYIKGNDAYVAAEFADRLNVRNIYFSNDLSEEPVEIIINRFISMGEGRIDNFADYLDGFKTWKTLYESGVEGIIRGDEGFGCHRYWSDIIVSLNQSINTCSDIANLKDYKKYGFKSQEVPDHLKRKTGESLSTWRDRLFHEHTIPTVFAALSDLKLAYVEQINPFLSGRILRQVRQQPDCFRTEKFLFKKIVNSVSPSVDYAKSVSSAPLSVILKEERFAKLLRAELSSPSARSLFPASFLKFVIEGIRSGNTEITAKQKTFSFYSFIKKIIPQPVKNLLQKLVLPEIDHNLLAFRILLITRMNYLLRNCKI